ncbi:MAG: helix-hairpin-helix domain-containing protein, partial [Candidatus Thermoplasmatota archaeon]
VIGEKHTIGGLVGTYNFGNEIHNSYATGEVSGNSSVGGLIGENAGSTVSNSYAKGRVSGEDYVGGLIGGNYNGTVETSYADENTTGQTDLVGADQYGTFTGSELLTTAEMTGEEAQENMSGFDFEETWETVDGSHKGAIEDGYPILQDLSREKQLKAQDVYQYDGEDGFLSNYWWLIFPMVIAAVLAIGISIALNRERRAIQQPSQKRQRPPPSQRKSYQQQPPQKQQKAQQQLQSQEEPSKEEPSTEIPKEEAFVELSKLTGVGPSKAERLYENGFHTLEDLEGVSKEELQEVKGIGASLAEKILDSLEEVK